MAFQTVMTMVLVRLSVTSSPSCHSTRSRALALWLPSGSTAFGMSDASEANLLEFIRERVSAKPHLEALLSGSPPHPRTFDGSEPGRPSATWPLEQPSAEKPVNSWAVTLGSEEHRE